MKSVGLRLGLEIGLVVDVASAGLQLPVFLLVLTLPLHQDIRIPIFGHLECHFCAETVHLL